jgi:phospholipid/cholesterol/gamma-HCH transport system substrate-binding protein
MFKRSRHPRDLGMSPFRAGVIAIVILVTATYFAFTKASPFADPYEFTAVFDRAGNLKVKFTPVRIAGVDVGEVTEVQPIGTRGAARVKMKVKDKGLPIHEDAELKIRPRIFLEGNFFVDVQPGSPSAPVLKDGGVIPVQQTATPVQFDELLITLQKDTRRDLQVFLQEYSKALVEGGAKGFNESIKYWESAYRNASIANEASLGTREHDLSRLLRGQQRTFRALGRHEQNLKDLVSNFNTTAAAFAREDAALEAAIPELRDVLREGEPALRSLNGSLPSLRAFARDALPGTRSSGPTLDAALPFIRQARLLVRRRELRGLAADLRVTIPALARLNANTIPFLAENRALSSCQNNVVLPFAKTPIPDPDFPANSGQPFYKQAPRGLVGLSGESRITDANSPMFRVQAGGGATTIETGDGLFAQSPFPILSVRPATPEQRPVFRPNVPCETQQPPDLNAPAGPGDPTAGTSSSKIPLRTREDRKAWEELKRYGEYRRLEKQGVGAINPMEYTDRAERLMARRLRYERTPKGVYARKSDLRRKERSR